MIKVVKMGIDPSTWKKEITCTANLSGMAGCGSILEIEVEDLVKKKRTESDYQGSYEVEVAAVECIVCKQFTEVSSVPAYIMQRIPFPKKKTGGSAYEENERRFG